MAENMNNEEVLVTIKLEDGTDLQCIALTIFEAQGKEYVALMPEDEKDEEDPEIVFYQYVEDENGDADLLSIEDDEEYEIVEDAFDELLDSIEYDELVKAGKIEE